MNRASRKWPSVQVLPQLRARSLHLSLNHSCFLVTIPFHKISQPSSTPLPISTLWSKSQITTATTPLHLFLLLFSWVLTKEPRSDQSPETWGCFGSTACDLTSSTCRRWSAERPPGGATGAGSPSRHLAKQPAEHPCTRAHTGKQAHTGERQAAHGRGIVNAGHSLLFTCVWQMNKGCQTQSS